MGLSYMHTFGMALSGIPTYRPTGALNSFVSRNKYSGKYAPPLF
jgi:hypothetical protein